MSRKFTKTARTKTFVFTSDESNDLTDFSSESSHQNPSKDDKIKNKTQTYFPLFAGNSEESKVDEKGDAANFDSARSKRTVKSSSALSNNLQSVRSQGSEPGKKKGSFSWKEKWLESKKSEREEKRERDTEWKALTDRVKRRRNQRNPRKRRKAGGRNEEEKEEDGGKDELRSEEVGGEDEVVIIDESSSSSTCDVARCGGSCEGSKPVLDLDELKSRSRREVDEDGGDVEEGRNERDEAKHHEMVIGGVRVLFPVVPYSCQVAVMSKLMQGCNKEQNCLLESPTGSGKTLALLCGALAWQEKCSEEMKLKTGAFLQEKCSFLQFSDTDEDEIFQPRKKLCQTEETPNDELKKGPTEETSREQLKVPKIYYGSRTHRQIEQVIREFKKTAYRHKKMTILSSREFTCIQHSDKNKTELCNTLLDPLKGRGCPYWSDNNKNKMSSHAALEHLGLETPWDIEDFVTLGARKETCPYFSARGLMADADIIFCPYNYLVDPSIRESMKLELKGEIVILDEAHNIEDVCRDVGGANFREDHISNAALECEVLSKKRGQDFPYYDNVRTYLQKFINFIKMHEVRKDSNFSESSSSHRWTGKDLMTLFDINGLGKERALSFNGAAAAVMADYVKAREDQRKKDETPQPTITQPVKRLLEELVFTLQMISSEKFAGDYRACVIEAVARDATFAPDNTWISSSQGSRKVLRTLQLMCMNPAVIFEPLAAITRTIILASGTLSPTSSFQSELGTVFPHMLDANHVVPKEQVYIRGIPSGPTGQPLIATFANVNSWGFQDELGKLLVQVCTAVPHGVLCFFSSYAMMKKQVDRWRQNGCWERLECVKRVLQEPRGASGLDEVMTEFRNVIDETSPGPQDGLTGALLLAVFRGKVAEGIDFSDNEARCVLAVGIPYAVRKEPSVDLKFSYNDENHPRGLLKGGEWYGVQAFRALNQALGRCVRHRNDWGAVLLVDQRFSNPAKLHYLPKWIRTMWRNSVQYNLTEDLEKFVASQVEREREKTADS